MTNARVRALLNVAPLLLVCGVLLACNESSPAEVLRVTLSNADTFEYPTVSGDEEGVRITTQPQHAAVSVIRRDAETNWVVTYVYQPVAGYVGSDVVELEVLTNSDGMSPPDIRRLTIEFSVHE